jgi:hypothetical protein
MELKIKSRIGKRYGRLVVISFHGMRPNIGSVWNCRCDCGKCVHVPIISLNCGNTKSCGCLRHISKIKHGFAKRGMMSPEYRAWAKMKERCQNKRDKSYHNYGGRGIKVCKRWQKFLGFLRDMGKKPTLNHSIERVNNSLGYKPSNCIWATVLEQANNKRNNVWVEKDGIRLTASQWSRKLKLPRRTVSTRLKNGWSERRALTTKLLKTN